MFDRLTIFVVGMNRRLMGPVTKSTCEVPRVFDSLEHVRTAILTDHESSEGHRTDRRGDARGDQPMIGREGKHLGRKSIYILR
jgi:hypothetical protein